MKAAFHNLGCKVNACETEKMIYRLRRAGYEIVDFDSIADIYVVNTCTVTNIADKKSRQMLRRARALNPRALVIACGCYVESGSGGFSQDTPEGRSGEKNIEKTGENSGESSGAKTGENSEAKTGENSEAKSAAKIPEKRDIIKELSDTVDIFIGNKDKDRLEEIIEEYLKGRDEFKGMLPANGPGSGEGVPRLKDHTRAYIKIQDGCSQFCSYCIIPYVRGRIKSAEPSEIYAELSALAKEGVKEAVLTGIHLSSYGIDLLGEDKVSGKDRGKKRYGSYNEAAAGGEYINRELIEVIKGASRIEGIERIRLGSLEVRIITDELLSALSDIPEFCPHFHLSLQSGSDTVLRRMNRHYDTEEYLEKVSKIRKYFPRAAITTDVIVGFPGETEEEFEETRAFLNEVDFYETHIFKYSRRKGTVADRAKDQVKESIKNERAAILAKDNGIRMKSFRESFAGEETEVLFEEKKLLDNEAWFTGFNREYVKFAVKTEEDLSNRIVRGKAVLPGPEEYLVFFY